MGKIRTFLAVDVSNSVRSYAAKWIDRCARRAMDYRWVDPQNLHLTLNFLGDLPERDIPEVCRVAKQALRQVHSFQLSLEGLGGFPRADRPRVVWLGIDEGSAELCAIQERLADALLKIGFPRDRLKYTPHLTLGRLRRGGRWSDDLIELLGTQTRMEAVGCLVSRVVVYSSFLEKSGPSYTPMSGIDLA